MNTALRLSTLTFSLFTFPFSLFTFAFLLFTFPFCLSAPAQSCRPAELDYIVRDEKGKIMSEEETKSVFAQMPKPAQGVHTLDVAADGTLVGYSAKPAASKLASIYYVDAKTCRLKVDEFTLKHAGRTMRLIFGLDIERRSYTFDSLPFQNGTFRLEQTNLTDVDNNAIIPATRWNKVTKSMPRVDAKNPTRQPVMSASLR